MAKQKVNIDRLADAIDDPSERNNVLIAWLSENKSRDVRSITWVKDTHQWAVITLGT